MKKLPWAILAVVLLVVGLSLASLNPVRNLIDNVFGRDTISASGDVVLERLRESETLEAAKGTFNVPVVVCNGTPKSFEERSDADALLRSCNGIADEKATVLVEADVRAVIDLGELGRDDVEIDGTTIRVTLPEPTLAEPSVDAETGVLIVGLDTSIFPGKLPDDYLADAAAEGKRAVNGVAERSGLLDLASSSASGLFESLLTSFGFTDVEIVFTAPSGGA